jgi:LPS-assembly lipoprotein
MRRREFTAWVALLAGLALAGCGFHLRGQSPLPFASAHVEAQPGSPLASLLVESLRLNGKTVADSPQAAEVAIRLERERRGKDILSLSGGGKVREYRLSLRVTLSAYDRGGRVLLAPSELTLTRDLSYDDAKALAKEAEEVQLMRDMEQEMLRQILRRLAYAKP